MYQIEFNLWVVFVAAKIVFQTETTLVVTVSTAKVISCPTWSKQLDDEFVIIL